MKSLLRSSLVTLGLITNLTANNVIFEDFEDATVGYTVTVADDLRDITNRDYFGRIDGTSGLPMDVAYSNQQGSGFYGAQDTDSAFSGNIDFITLTWSGVNISGASDISFSGLFAEDTASDGLEDWDTDSSVIVEAQIDGGGYTRIFAIESIDALSVNDSPAIDTNFDGLGDGATITDTFTEFTADIDALVGTGSTLDLRITISNLTAGDEDIAFDNITVTATNAALNNDGSLTAALGVSEPVNLPTTADTMAEAIDTLDFTLSDGGSTDSQPMGVSQIVVNVSGTSTETERGKVTWLLNGPDASNVTGTYSSGTITFSGLSISVADGGNEPYTVRAYFNDNTSISDNATFVLSVDGDTDVTTTGGGTSMGTTTPVNNGSGGALEATATQLAFTTQPAGSVSGVALTTQPVVTARDAAGNTDVDFTETITLSEASLGTLTGGSVAASDGVATFTALTFNASVDQTSFTLTANDQDGVDTNLPTVNSNAVISDVVATQLFFTTQPVPLTVDDGIATNFTTVPVVAAIDNRGIIDTGYTTPVTLSEVNGAGSATLSSTGDTDPSAATVTVNLIAGRATFIGLAATYNLSGATAENFNLQASSGGLTTANSSQLTANPSTPVITANMSDALLIDTNLTGNVNPGDTLRYTATISVATANATGINFTVPTSALNTLVVGSVTTSQGTVTTGNTAGDTTVAVNVGDVTVGSSVTITFDVLVGTPTTDPATISKQGSVSGSNFTTFATNDPDTAAAGDATAVSFDGVAPRVRSITRQVANPTSSDSVIWFVSFDQAVSNVDTADFTVSGTTGGITRVEAVLSANDYQVTASGGDLATLTGTVTLGFAAGQNIVDISGNPLSNFTATGGNDNTYDIDNSGPVVTSVAVPTNRTYRTGENLDFTVNFDEDVTVTGTPSLSLNIGGTNVEANYSLGNSTQRSLVFRYTVLAGNLDTDGVTLGTSIALNGGTIRDAVNNNANLTLNSVGVTSNVLVDAAGPRVTSVTVPSDATYGVNEALDFTVNFDENVLVSFIAGPPRIEITVGSTVRQAAMVSGNNTSALLFRYTVQAGDLDTDGISVGGTIVAIFDAIRDTNNNDADLTLRNVGSTTGVLVDTFNDPPVVATNTGISVNEGATEAINTSELNEGDPDDAGTGLTYTITTLPANGQLQLNSGTLALNGTFTQDDIDNNRVQYVHDGSETTSDSFIFSLADGGEDSAAPVTGQTFVIAVNALNDAPVVATNTGISVDEGGTEVLNNTELNEGDPDDSGTGLTYTVTTLPSNGDIQLNSSDLPLNGTFTQDDIDNNRVQYVHDGSETTSDSFVFSLADGGENSAATLTGQIVNIMVNAVNDVPVLADLGGDSFNYIEGNGAVVVDQGANANVTDSDSSDFNGGNLTVTIAAGGVVAEDLLSVLNTVTLGGNTAGSSVTVGGTAIGTLGNAIAAGNDFVVNFNANATPALVRDLVRAVSYENTNAAVPNTQDRTVRFTVNDGDGDTSVAQDVTISVFANPAFTMVFSPNSATVGVPVTLTYTIDNTVNSGVGATSLDFTHNLPSGLTVAATPNASTTCTGGTLTAVANSGVVSYTGGSIAAGASCTVTVDVVATASGILNNTTGSLTSSLGNSGAASATFTAIEPTEIVMTIESVLSPLVAGGSAENAFLLKVENVGPSDVTGLQFDRTGVFPAGVSITNVATAATAGTFDGSTWTLDLTNGASAQIQLQIEVADTVASGADVIPVGFNLTSSGQPIASSSVTSVSDNIDVVRADDTSVSVTVSQTIELQSGFLVSQVEVTNNGTVAIPAFRLFVLDLPSDVTVYNATGSMAFPPEIGNQPFILSSQSLAAGASRTFHIEFFRPSLDANFTPRYEMQLLSTAPEPPAAGDGTVLPLLRQQMLTNGDFLIEVASTPGSTYAVEYSSDMTIWTRVQPAVIASANRLQWVDNGPPKTDSHPSTTGSRFYRVIDVTPQ